MKPIAEIFSQGEEIVTGQTVDSNSAWLSQQLVELGFSLKRHTAVGDNLDDLIGLFSEIAERADCCICTGGLGPTIDDLTAEAISAASGLSLQFDEQAFAQIQQYYACRNRVMPEANRKQAMLPKTALRIDNGFGTAPGFAMQFKRCWFICLPGVPSEMKQMFGALVQQQLKQGFSLQPDCLVTLRSVGIGESAIQQCLQNLVLPEGVQLGFRAASDEVQTKLLFPAGFSASAKHSFVEQVERQIGDYVFAVDGLHQPQGDLLDVVDGLLGKKAYSLAVLETASQGLLAAKCVSRDWLKAAFVSLDARQIATDWQVSIDQDDYPGFARRLASELKSRRTTDLALVQIHTGDLAAYRDKNQSIVLYNALLTPDGLFASQHSLAGAIKSKQNQAALLALDLLRRYLQNKCH